jgi:hypothetical protein
MDDSLHEDPDVGVLETLDPGAAAVAVREEREHVPCHLLDGWIVVTTGDGHDRMAESLCAPSRRKTAPRRCMKGSIRKLSAAWRACMGGL